MSASGVLDPEHKASLTARPRFAWPRWVRVLFMGLLFAIFFLGGPFFAFVLFPFLQVGTRERALARTMWLVHGGMGLIMRTAAFFGVVRLELPPPPAEVDRARPYVMISNHPTFIDMIVILGSFRPLSCVTNGRWWRHWALGRLLRSTYFIAGPDAEHALSSNTLDRMVAALEGGLPLLVFPEGQRSRPDRLRRFHRGAFEAAVRARVPIVPVYLDVDPPYLTKTIPLTRPPAIPPTYRFEWLAPVVPREGDDARSLHEALERAYAERYAAHRRERAGDAEADQAQKS